MGLEKMMRLALMLQIKQNLLPLSVGKIPVSACFLRAKQNLRSLPADDQALPGVMSFHDIPIPNTTLTGEMHNAFSFAASHAELAYLCMKGGLNIFHILKL
ncbi:hypothetical protein RF11_10924 [Thelohanellus kitauei]|uniref:Uncharacterized protein n=1 Tax=Thelohanellus kitauei TaxID=669202 RepID=A0A0C2N3S6_THEKT|nr:hypothetical protein RF11_10924 [Thelohanellus kitauei]